MYTVEKKSLLVNREVDQIIISDDPIYRSMDVSHNVRARRGVPIFMEQSLEFITGRLNFEAMHCQNIIAFNSARIHFFESVEYIGEDLVEAEVTTVKYRNSDEAEKLAFGDYIRRIFHNSATSSGELWFALKNGEIFKWEFAALAKYFIPNGTIIYHRKLREINIANSNMLTLGEM